MNTTPDYWHLLTGYDEKTDIFAYMIAGPSNLGPDDAGQNGKPIREMVIPNDMVGEFRYVTSFTHEPTVEDLDDHSPEGHRSWEQDQPEDDDE